MKTLVRKKQSGQALVEFALVVPMLLLLLLGVIEIGRYAYISILVGNAARAGAAYGAQGNAQSTCPTPAPCGIQTAAINDFHNNGQQASLLTVSSTNSCGCDTGGTITTYGCTALNAGNCPLLGSPAGNWVVMVSVTASGTFNALFSFPGIPSSLTVSRTATMRVS